MCPGAGTFAVENAADRAAERRQCLDEERGDRVGRRDVDGNGCGVRGDHARGARSAGRMIEYCGYGPVRLDGPANDVGRGVEQANGRAPAR